MTTTKLIISSIVGASTLGGASVGCYHYFKSKAPESSQSASNKNGNTDSSKTQTSRTGKVVNPTQRDEGSVSSGIQIAQPESREQGTSSSLASSSSHTTSSDGGVGA